jgi:hypothetical protein
MRAPRFIAIGKENISMPVIINGEQHYIQVRARYPQDRYPEMDDVIHRAVGRLSDYSGTDFYNRDLGFVCNSVAEAKAVTKAIEGVGLIAVVDVD